MKNLQSLRGIGIVAFVLVGAAVYGAMLLFDFEWFWRVLAGAGAGFVAQSATIGIKLCVDFNRRQGAFDASEEQFSNTVDWALQPGLALLIPVSVMALAAAAIALIVSFS